MKKGTFNKTAIIRLLESAFVSPPFYSLSTQVLFPPFHWAQWCLRFAVSDTFICNLQNGHDNPLMHVWNFNSFIAVHVLTQVRRPVKLLSLDLWELQWYKLLNHTTPMSMQTNQQRTAGFSLLSSSRSVILQMRVNADNIPTCKQSVIAGNIYTALSTLTPTCSVTSTVGVSLYPVISQEQG